MGSENTVEAISKGSGLWDGDPEQHAGLAEWLEQQAADPWMQRIAGRTLSFLQLKPGTRVLEVGCGTGVFLPLLARAVGPAGQVIGIDHSAAFLDEARQRIVTAGCASLVDVRQADAYHLPIDDAHFDAAHAEHVFEHLEDPDAALREMRRVVKPGGWIVVGEPHLLGTDVDHPDPEGVHLVLAHGYRRFRSPRIGLELNRRMAQVGLIDRRVELFTRLVTELDSRTAQVFADSTDEAVSAGLLTRGRAAALLRDLHRASQGGSFTAYYPFFLVAGRVPWS